MFGWIEHVKRYEPGLLGAMNVALPLAPTVTSKPPPSAVTVCSTLSAFATDTVAPAAAVAGENANPVMRSVVGAFCFFAYGPDGTAAATLAGGGEGAGGW
jgi:hypothetical protein